MAWGVRHGLKLPLRGEPQDRDAAAQQVASNLASEGPFVALVIYI